MSGTALPLSQLQELIGELSSSQSRESDLLLLQLDEENGRRLRLCAIPHSFDAATLQALDPSLSLQDVKFTLEQFQVLPAVTLSGDCLVLHDVARQELFSQWLSPEHRPEFAAASARLVEFYKPDENDNPVDAATKQISRLFHLLGADPDAGLWEFQDAYQSRRSLGRFSDCESLLRLLREYEPALEGEQRNWLNYYQAEVADDNRDLDAALAVLDRLRQDTPAAALRSMVLLRSASVLRRLERLPEAESAGREALKFVNGVERSPIRHLIHHELGLIARDRGDFEEARTELMRSIELAKAASSHRDVVVAYNSLGTLLRKPDPREALKLFRECLDLLDPDLDKLRMAQVLNNLGLASADLQEWENSSQYFQASLQIKRDALDLAGEASTLLNVSRVYRAEEKWEDARSALMMSAKLFEDVRDPVRAAQALRELARLMRLRGGADAAAHYAVRAVECLRRAGREADASQVEQEFAPKKSRRRWLIWVAVILAVAVAIVLAVELV
ncbi:tetratricopeptide (TPR) repeat protein [Bradyrhizobium sp. F1.4.3]|uniref:tetratricopeptide repeat protein n=1 Tax=Bradyrhizobium sp. F1.4.3 TaxID=3156356 RepID=UPI0033926241